MTYYYRLKLSSDHLDIALVVYTSCIVIIIIIYSTMYNNNIVKLLTMSYCTNYIQREPISSPDVRFCLQKVKFAFYLKCDNDAVVLILKPYR